MQEHFNEIRNVKLKVIDVRTALCNALELTEHASSGDAKSQLQLALNYHRGYGVPMNKELAAKWFTLAADSNQTAQGYPVINKLLFTYL